MGSILTNGVFLPAEGERNCYEGLAANWTALDGMIGGYNVHISNTTIHVTAEDKQAWNGKADASALTAHTGDTTIHVTAEDKQAWNGKADASALTAHTGDTTIHVTAEDKAKWDAVTSKADDSDVVHKSGNETINGNKTFSSINGVEPSSLSLPSGNRNDIIDISSYLVNLDGAANTYTAPANGWIAITMNNCAGMQAYIAGLWGHQIVRPSAGGVRFLMPILKNQTASIFVFGGTIESARFIPCQGNV